jgi:hypothetical protein
MFFFLEIKTIIKIVRIMKGFKKCNNGHFFKENLPACPYCPNNKGGSGSDNGGSDMNKTMVSGAGGAEFTSTEVTGADSTEHFTSGSGGGDKTQVFGGGAAAQNPSDTHLVGNNKVSSPSSAPKRNLDRTFIGGIEEPSTTDGSESGSKSPNPAAAPRSTRKIVGWLISYTLDPMGIDWRIYEGTNLIGRDAKNTIIISRDPTISSEHATILFRNGKFKIKDKMTANGSFINGVELEVEEAYDLNDGDELRLGNSVFRFKSAV